MRGMKGYGQPLTPRGIRGEELIPTSDLRALFPHINRVQLGRILDRAGVTPDPITRGNRGEKHWPRAAAIAALAANEVSRLDK